MVVKVRLQNAAAVKELLGRLTGPQAARAIVKGINDTAFAARKAYQDEVRRVFDRPTKFIIDGIYVRQATAKDPEAIVETADRARSSVTPAMVLKAQAEGGQRRAKRFESVLRQTGHLPNGWFAMPGQGANIDAHGNISQGQIMQILSQLRAQVTAGYARNMAHGKRGIAAQRRAGGRFFVVPPGGRSQPGIYQREFMGRGVTPVLIFARRATYRQRMSMENVVNNGRLEETLHRRIRYRIYQTLEGKA